VAGGTIFLFGDWWDSRGRMSGAAVQHEHADIAEETRSAACPMRSDARR
jgi:hypothetical protein